MREPKAGKDPDSRQPGTRQPENQEQKSREPNILYRTEVSHTHTTNFLEEVRASAFMAQVRTDALALKTLGQELDVRTEAKGKTSVIITAREPDVLDDLAQMAEDRGYELPDQDEITIPSPEKHNHNRPVLMHSPTEYTLGNTYRPVHPDRPINDHVGESYVVVGYDLDLERDTALTFRIRFEDGHELHVYPEEIDNTYHSVVTEDNHAR